MQRLTIGLACLLAACQPQSPKAQPTSDAPLTMPVADAEVLSSPTDRDNPTQTTPAPLPTADGVARGHDEPGGASPVEPNNPPPSAGPLFWLYGSDAKVTFHRGSSSVTHIMGSALQQAVALAQASPGRVRIAVYSSSQGSSGFNLALSAKRAHALAQLLVARGIDCSRLDAVGWGETRQIRCNDCDVSRKNKRIEISIDTGADPPTGAASHDVCAALPE